MKQALSYIVLLLCVVGALRSQVAVTDTAASGTFGSDTIDLSDTVAVGDSLTVQPVAPRLYDLPRLMLGFRVGLNLADMSYSHAPISRYSHFWRHKSLIGITAQVPLPWYDLSVRPELLFVARGDSLNWLDVNYGITAHYVDFRLPITWNYRFGDGRVSPYLVLAPELNFAYGGSIGYSADDYPQRISTQLNRSNMRSTDLALMLGAGCDFVVNSDVMPIYVSVEAGYNWGLINSFSRHERAGCTDEPSSILNNFFGAELWKGKRHNRGVELSMRVAFPLDGEFLARYRKRRQVMRDTVVLVDLKIDTLPGSTDTVFITTPAPRTRTAYHTKECFTIAELYNQLSQGEDITGKRICMFDIKFDFDSYVIRPESQKPLNELVRMMWDYPQMTIEVYGHTDSIGTAEYNQKLSENRANAVVEYLSSHGVSPSRIKSFGYGLRYPIDTNETEEGRFRNRRVEFEVITIGGSRKYHQ